MTNYQATPFRGEWNEDPKFFLGWFLQCMGAADDNMKAHQFVYYLQAGSDADEWFEDLPEDERRSWVIIEKLFRRKWLKEEVIVSTTETVTCKNEPQPTSTCSTLLITATITSCTLATTAYVATDSTMTNPTNAGPISTQVDSSAPQTNQHLTYTSHFAPQTPNRAQNPVQAASTPTQIPHDSKPEKTAENGSSEPKYSPNSPQIAQNQVFSPQYPSYTSTSSPTTSSAPTKAKTTPSQHSELAQANATSPRSFANSLIPHHSKPQVTVGKHHNAPQDVPHTPKTFYFDPKHPFSPPALAAPSPAPKPPEIDSFSVISSRIFAIF
jgi:hypothetical protein